MRLRVSQSEAQFLLETLQSRKADIEGVIERKKQLDIEVYRLKHEAMLNPTIFIDPSFKQKNEELQRLQAQAYEMSVLVNVYESLIFKLSIIASGQKRRGRYPSAATRHVWRLESVVSKK